jgi:hypothetical protein
MLTTPDINALQLRLARERIIRDLERAMRSHASEPTMAQPAGWAAEHRQSPALLLKMTSE